MDSDIPWSEIPDLALDTHSLPPLNALSSSSDSSLHHLDLLDIFSLDQEAPSLTRPLTPLTPPTPLSDSDTHTLSHCTDDTSHTTSAHSDTKPSPHHPTPAPAPALVLELTTRLASAGGEATTLRKRCACLVQQNRSLRAALDHANARLVAVAQAAAQPANAPVVLSLAHLSSVSADIGHGIATALTLSEEDQLQQPRKKRKRVTGAATTMACVMFIWGALVGTPGLIKGGSSYRSEANLPAVWTSGSGSGRGGGGGGGGGRPNSALPAVSVNRVIKEEHVPWQPNCVRLMKHLPQLPHPTHHTEEKKIKSQNHMFVDMDDNAAANVVSHADTTDIHRPEYSYVLCRDADNAVDSIKSCANNLRTGKPCGQPHTISLILPAETAGLEVDDNDTNIEPALAEVQCEILSVARIPSPGKDLNNGLGRIVGSVRESRTVMVE